jgi:uncharacterized protein YnzC (UPF0291/DUF896 family)
MDSPLFTIETITPLVHPDPELQGAILIRPEHLPNVRRQMEAALEQISAIKDQGELIEGRLKEVISAEEELKSAE